MEKIKNFTIFLIIVICGSIVGSLFSNIKSNQTQGTQEIILTEEDVNKVIEVLKENKLFNTMLELRPSFREDIKRDMNIISKDRDLFQKLKSGIDLSYYDIEGKLPSTEKELSKYILKAPDEELYQTLLVEFKHAKKSKCQVIPLSKVDKEETANVKTKMVLAAYKTPYKGASLPQEKIDKITQKMLNNYKKNGGDMNKLGILFGLKPGYLNNDDICNIQIDIFKALLSLPKKETIMFYRANGQYYGQYFIIQ